jgi:hypothetical protein
MPDWRKAEDYAYTESLTLHQWAWEFLRRNPAYREDWASLQARITSGELVSDRTLIDVNIGLASRWDLYVMADPAVAAHEMESRPHFRYTTDVMVHPDGTLRGGVQWTSGPLNPILVFNLQMPIDSQLEVAKGILRYFRQRLGPAAGQVRQRKGKPQRAKFPLYIRALDGRLEGVSEGKIGLALFKGDEPRLKARQALKAARLMTSSGYRDLLLSPDTWHRLNPPGKRS